MIDKKDEEKLSIFKRRILRRIFGQTKEGDTWRIRHNKELSELFKELPVKEWIKINRLR